MTSGNDLRDERGAGGHLDTLPGADPASTLAANGGGPAAEGAPLRSPRPADAPTPALDDRGLSPEAAEADQLVDRLRTAAEALRQELAPGSTDGVGWDGLLGWVRAAARTQRAIAESERKVLELRERAAAEVDAVYEAAAGRPRYASRRRACEHWPRCRRSRCRPYQCSPQKSIRSPIGIRSQQLLANGHSSPYC